MDSKAWISFLNIAYDLQMDPKLTSCGIVDELLTSFKPQEGKVAIMRFGLDGRKPMHVLEIARSMRLSKGRIGQIVAAVKRKMQHPTRKRFVLEQVFPKSALGSDFH